MVAGSGLPVHYAMRLWATWRSGYAAACKAVYTGSIPVVAFLGREACPARYSPR